MLFSSVASFRNISSPEMLTPLFIVKKINENVYKIINTRNCPFTFVSSYSMISKINKIDFNSQFNNKSLKDTVS